MLGLKFSCMLTCTFLLTLTGTLVFLRGFLLNRTVLEQVSQCKEDFASHLDDHTGHSVPGCWEHGSFKRAIIIIIDALKYEFISFNVTLQGKDNIPPYKNKLKIVYEMERSKPLNTLQFRFIADPPTTTLQRLKGLTTGSLPTFVDAGTNFASSEILEDNFIDQMLKQDKKIKFFGDDTWMSLFPRRFFKHFEYPSFDVKDLHSVDNGILTESKLFEELKKNDWDVTIAHFLGVDHCGHRFGPNHEAMADKLKQMDSVIRNVTRLMSKDTILFVMGDHGMTRTGDHGGDSTDELEAGLFIYSPAQIVSKSQREVTSVSQTDFVPTVSLLLGLPIPFSNLGMVIPELFTHCPWWDTDTNDARRIYHKVKALRLNTRQISRYLHAYQQVASDLPYHTLMELNRLLAAADEDLKRVHSDVLSGDDPDSLIRKLIGIEKQYVHYAQLARETCQAVWAKFDLILMVTGIVIILSGTVMGLFFTVARDDEKDRFLFSILFLMCGALLLIVYMLAHSMLFSDSVPPLMGFILALVIIFTSVISLRKSLRPLSSLICQDNIVSCVLVFMHCCIFFSNSFVVYEDIICVYLIQTLIAFYSFTIINSYIQSKRTTKQVYSRSAPLRHNHKSKPSFDIMQFFSNPVTITVFISTTCYFLLRGATIFLVCREEQSKCEDSIFTLALSSMDKSSVNQRYIFSIVCLGLMVLLVRQFLKYYGNLTGTDAAVVTMRYAPPIASVCVGLYWALQAMPDRALDALSPWQQAFLAQIVYIVLCVSLVVIAIWPLPLYTCPVSSTAAALNSEDPALVIPTLYNQLKVQHSSTSDDQKPPVVYGLGSAYTASQVCVVSLISLQLALLLGDGFAPSLAVATLVFYLLLEMYSAVLHVNSNIDRDREGKEKQAIPGPLCSGVVLVSLLSSTFFYATGHQATIPSIRFEAAYTGFYGHFSNMILPGLLIWLNTFAGPVLFSLACPLLVTWPALHGAFARWMTNQKSSTSSYSQPEKWQGDFRLFNDGERLRKDVFFICSGQITIACFRLLSASCAAAIHRRHLMVWKIFAPRLVYEAAFFLTTSVVVSLAYVFILRVDKALVKFVNSLPSDQGEKKK